MVWDFELGIRRLKSRSVFFSFVQCGFRKIGGGECNFLWLHEISNSLQNLMRFLSRRKSIDNF